MKVRVQWRLQTVDGDKLTRLMNTDAVKKYFVKIYKNQSNKKNQKNQKKSTFYATSISYHSLTEGKLPSDQPVQRN